MTNTHGTHCEDADGLLVCGWPEMHADATAQAVHASHRMQDHWLTCDLCDDEAGEDDGLWADIEFDREFADMIRSMYPEA